MSRFDTHRFHPSASAWSVGLIALFAAEMANAAPEQVRVSYQSSPDCPDRAWFLERIRARTTRAEFDPAEQGPRLELVVRVDGGLLEGSADLTGPGMDPIARNVHGQSCEEVVDALALIVAVALDPTVAEKPATDAPASLAEEPATATSPAPAQKPPAGAAPSPPVAPPPPASPTPVRAEPARPAPGASPVQASGRSWEFGCGGGVAVAGGMSPYPAPGVLLFCQAGPPGSSSWSPLAVLSLELDQSAVIRKTVGDARFTRTVGRVAGCPVELSAGPSFRARPCVAFEAGGLNGAGGNAVGATSRQGFWAAPGLELRAEWRPGTRVLVVADGLLTRPVVRDKFYFGPSTDGSAQSTEVFTAPVLAAGASLGLGMLFR